MAISESGIFYLSRLDVSLPRTQISIPRSHSSIADIYLHQISQMLILNTDSSPQLYECVWQSTPSDPPRAASG